MPAAKEKRGNTMKKQVLYITVMVNVPEGADADAMVERLEVDHEYLLNTLDTNESLSLESVFAEELNTDIDS